MGENKGDSSKKLSQQAAPPPPHPPAQQQSQQQLSSSNPKDPLDESKLESSRQHHHQQSSTTVAVTGAPFISPSLFVQIGATSSSPFEQQFEPVNPKRTRYSSGQWKLLPSPSSQQKRTHMAVQPVLAAVESSPSPTNNPINAQAQVAHTTAASSSDTASSPSHSPIPSVSAGSGQDTNKPEGEQVHHQYRKGKYVSPVWKPNEMLWLARGWRIQYQTGSEGSRSDHLEGAQGGSDIHVQSTRGKTRADKDREVAEFLNRHGVNRDAKTAGTKWDNMLGEFRKVYEWERGAEREQIGKSYFRLSPYERKLHRLPASFDEEVFEELSDFMGSRMRTPHSRAAIASVMASGDDGLATHSGNRALPPPPHFKEDDLSLSARAKQLALTSGGDQAYLHGGRGGLLGFDPSLGNIVLAPSSKELRRIGKVRMTWEESVSLWAEEGEHHRGRVRLPGSSFLNADELTFFDEAMVACTMEAFEDGPLKGFSVDKFVTGHQVKVFGRRKSSSSSASASSGFNERVQLPLPEPSITRPMAPSWEFQDATDYYLGCLRTPPTTLPSLFELPWHLQAPPAEDFRFPLRKDVYRDLPQGKELFFTTSMEPLDCRAITYDIVGPIIRNNPILSAATTTIRDSFIGLWDDCINRVISKFCSVEMVVLRKPSSFSSEPMQDQWPNVTGFVRNFCLWRGEEDDQLREGHVDPASSLVEKLFWSYMDLPYILGYYAVGYTVTFCALSRSSQDRIIRTDLCSLDLSSPSERLKALVPCYRIAGLLSLLADRTVNSLGGNYKQCPFSDFERIDLGYNGNAMEMTPSTVTMLFLSKRKWAAVKEIYDFLDHRITHAEFLSGSSEKDLTLVLKPRGFKLKPTNCNQLVEALKYVTKALVALHDLSFMHRDLCWEKVQRRVDRDNEWFICGFDDAIDAPQIYPHGVAALTESRGKHAPEMGRGLHGVKVDVWGVGQLVKTCGLGNLPKMLRELQNRCLEQNPEQRPTAADCYHHLLQVQSSLSASSGSSAAY